MDKRVGHGPLGRDQKSPLQSEVWSISLTLG